MSSKYGFEKTQTAPLHSIGIHREAQLSRIEPIITDILMDILHTYGEPDRDCIGREAIEDAQLFAVWTAPNIALTHPDDKKPLIVEFKEVTKKHLFVSTVQMLRLEILWGNNERIMQEHHPILFRIAEVLRDKTNLTVAVMSWCEVRSRHGFDYFNEEKVFEAQAG